MDKTKSKVYFPPYFAKRKAKMNPALINEIPAEMIGYEGSEEKEAQK